MLFALPERLVANSKISPISVSAEMLVGRSDTNATAVTCSYRANISSRKPLQVSACADVNGNTLANTPPARSFISANAEKCVPNPACPLTKRFPDSRSFETFLANALRLSSRDFSSIPAKANTERPPWARVYGGFWITMSWLWSGTDKNPPFILRCSDELTASPTTSTTSCWSSSSREPVFPPCTATEPMLEFLYGVAMSNDDTAAAVI